MIKLSEKSAISLAIATSKIHTYPAGMLMEYVNKKLGDKMKGDFDPEKTAEKLEKLPLPKDSHAKAILKEDFATIAKKLRKMSPEYDEKKVIDKVNKTMPDLAKRYFGVKGFKPRDVKIVEYFFEGYPHQTGFKDTNFAAYEVGEAESKELRVPVGIYVRRDTVTPGYDAHIGYHENIHDLTKQKGIGYDENVPQFEEGVGDVFARLFLHEVADDLGLLRNHKKIRNEIEVMRAGSRMYHNYEALTIEILRQGDLPLLRALLDIRKNQPKKFDWGGYYNRIIDGERADDAVLASYKGKHKKGFKKWFETMMKSEERLTEKNRRVLRMFSNNPVPRTLDPKPFRLLQFLMKKVEEGHETIPVKEIPRGLQGEIKTLKNKFLCIEKTKKKKGRGVKVLDPHYTGTHHLWKTEMIRCGIPAKHLV